MGKWARRALGAGIAWAAIGCGMLVYANRDVPPPSAAQRAAAFERAVQWMLVHREMVTAQGNPGLWWMVRVAAQRRGDARLAELVTSSLEVSFPPERRQDVWIRMWQPDAPISVPPLQTLELVDYQEGFVSALSCGETERQWGHAPGWRQSNQCRPWISGLLGLNRWCATHQLMVLRLLQDQHCPASMQPPTHLATELLRDIERLMWLDPTMKDASLQRVLMLAWTRGPEAIPPIWLWRVIDSQQADGGWQGNTQIVGGPVWLQPMWWRNVWSRVLPIEAVSEDSDFHPTAQGLLILALSLGAPSPANVALDR